MRLLSRSAGFDLAVGFGVAAGLVLITRRVDASLDGDPSLDAVGYGCVAVAGWALSLRRGAPALGLVVAAAAVTLYAARGYPGGPVFITPMVAAFCLASARPRARTVPVVVTVTGCFLLAGLVDGTGDAGWITLVFVGWMGAAVLLGEAAQARHAHLLAVAERAEYLERTREQEARRVAAEERLRVAREVHDVVANTLSGIALQAAVAQRLARSDAGVEALQAIRRSSKQGLDELRATLDVVREPDGSVSRRPAPGLADMQGLFREMRTAGLEIRMVTGGLQRPLGSSVEAAAYRIVQESLTNVIRHAGAAQASVCLTYQDDALELEVVDDGEGRQGTTRGHGIVGMRERALAIGGRFEAGPRSEGGFRVWAVLPNGAGR